MEKRKVDESDYYGSLEFGAELLWNGEFVLDITIIKIFTFTISPAYEMKQQEGHPRTDTGLVLDTVLFKLHPECKMKATEVSGRTCWAEFFFRRDSLNELHCFAALIHLEKVTKAEMEDLLESLPDRYSCQLGQCNSCKHPS